MDGVGGTGFALSTKSRSPETLVGVAMRNIIGNFIIGCVCWFCAVGPVLDRLLAAVSGYVYYAQVTIFAFYFIYITHAALFASLLVCLLRSGQRRRFGPSERSKFVC